MFSLSRKKKTHYEEGWDGYSDSWEAQVGKGRIRHLGDEWGEYALTDEIFSKYLGPHLNSGTRLLEIGCGGGKFSERLAGMCGRLVCADVSLKMLERTRARLEGNKNVAFQKLNGYDLHQFKRNDFDFVFSFDTFVHIDMEDSYSYLAEIKRVLKPGGQALLHFANLNSPEGWKKFVDEVPIHRGNAAYYNRFRFLTWEIVERFVAGLGFEILDHRKEPWRDILVFFRKPA
jgi:cyclopropane fatty-acyl-phospholipid synthase-like methyltransferase